MTAKAACADLLGGVGALSHTWPSRTLNQKRRQHAR